MVLTLRIADVHFFLEEVVFTVGFGTRHPPINTWAVPGANWITGGAC